jgi:DNA-binding transcriptional LysR family regulator
LDGEAYYRRCLAVVADIEDAEAAFGDAKPRELLRVDAHGTPRTPDDLDGHRMIGFVSSLTGSALALEFTLDGAVRKVAALSRGARARVRRAGRGAAGLSAVADAGLAAHPQSRQLAPRVRVFIDWLTREFAARGGETRPSDRSP